MVAILTGTFNIAHISEDMWIGISPPTIPK